MRDARYTKGPWEAFDHAGRNMRSYSQSSGVTGTGEHDKQLICGCFNDIGGDGVASANARLIAAAPELLEALERLVKEHKSSRYSSLEKRMADWQVAEAAIKKAKGEGL